MLVLMKHAPTGDNSDISTSISIRRTKHVRSSCAYAYVFEFSLAYAGVYAYAYICAYSLVKTSLHYTVRTKFGLSFRVLV